MGDCEGAFDASVEQLLGQVWLLMKLCEGSGEDPHDPEGPETTATLHGAAGQVLVFGSLRLDTRSIFRYCVFDREEITDVRTLSFR